MNEHSFKPIRNASSWHGADFKVNKSYEYHLEPSHIADLEQALGGIKRSGLELAALTPKNFPLPTMLPLLHSIGDVLRNGRGFALLRGFPIDQHEIDDLSIMYYGLCRHIGMGMTQNSDGGLIHYVTDGPLKPNQGNRGVGFPRITPLHVDLMDIVTLLCVRQATDSPHSHLSSSTTLYNEFLKRRPDLLPRLFGGYEWDRMNEHGEGETPTSGYRVPLFSLINGTLSCRYNRSWMSATNVAEKAPLSSLDEEAFALIDDITAETRFSFPFSEGDIQFCNNYTVLHGREAHKPEPLEERKRLLIRIWLNAPEFREFSDEAIIRYGVGYHGNLGWTAEELLADKHRSPRLRRDDGAIQLDI